MAFLEVSYSGVKQILHCTVLTQRMAIEWSDKRTDIWDVRSTLSWGRKKVYDGKDLWKTLSHKKWNSGWGIKHFLLLWEELTPPLVKHVTSSFSVSSPLSSSITLPLFQFSAYNPPVSQILPTIDSLLPPRLPAHTRTRSAVVLVVFHYFFSVSGSMC